MSDSVWPHRWQPTRLLCPWDSPSKNTGVGCHFLLQCMKVKSESEVAQSCPTLSDPMDCGPPGSSIHGIFQARVLEWGAIAFSVEAYNKVKWRTYCWQAEHLRNICTSFIQARDLIVNFRAEEFQWRHWSYLSTPSFCLVQCFQTSVCMSIVCAGLHTLNLRSWNLWATKLIFWTSFDYTQRYLMHLLTKLPLM